MSNKLTLVAIGVLLLATMPCRETAGQTVNDQGTWLALFAQGKACEHGFEHERLRWWFDGHLRFFDDSGGFGQSIVRPGIGWQVTENSVLWAGYGWIRTSPLRLDDVDEHRVWQQWTWNKTCEPFKVGARSRFEQRFVESLGDDTGLRFRQLIRAQESLPTCPPITFVVWDELFVNLNDTDWGAQGGFDQNRAFVGFGIKRFESSKLRVEIGYMNQYVKLGPVPNLSNHILAINFFRSP